MARKQQKRRRRTRARNVAPTQSVAHIEADYTHVKHDLIRIALFSGLIFVAQFVLKFVLGW